MPRIGSVDERFGSYNIEMAEVTGGNFWKPYGSKGPKAAPGKKPVQSSSTPAGMNPNSYQYRPPIDLSISFTEARRCAWPGVCPN